MAKKFTHEQANRAARSVGKKDFADYVCSPVTRKQMDKFWENLNRDRQFDNANDAIRETL